MNKPLALLAIALAAAFGTANAASDHGGHGGMNNSTQMAQMSGAHDMSSMSASMQMSDGVVKKVDAAAGKVTLQHGPLHNLDMPAMTMVFRLKEPSWAGQLKMGDKIRFVAESANGILTVVQYEMAK